MLVLASASPRRKELLKNIANNFDIIVSDFDEILPDNIAPMEIAEYFATKKALDVFEKNKNNIVIGSDTVIVFNNKVYGKPSNKEDAKRMLLDFSNNTHFVVTGVCVVSNKNTISFSSINEVSFYNLSEKEIDDYLSCDEYKDKAGSYAIQGKGALFIKKINGDYNSIVGLPVSQLNRILKSFFNI